MLRRLALRLPQAVCLASVLTSTADAQRAAPRPDLASFDRYVAQSVKDWGVPGLAISIVKDDSVVFARGYGVRALGSADPVDAHTLFAIGSTTKAMTALSLLMLQDAKKLSLEDPAQRWIPSLQLFDPVMTREITVRDLLTHHTGIPGTDQLWTTGDLDEAEIFRRMRFAKPTASFRNRYAYQNVQYAMAGAVLRSASGMTWDAFVSGRILAPLGMRETVPFLAQTRTMPNVASPHLRIDDTVRVIENRSVDPVAPAGSIWSSVSDMAKWMRFVLDSGRVGGQRLVSERAFSSWLSPQVVVPRDDFYPTSALSRPHFINYGLGWFLHDYAGDAVAMHTGSIDGMIAIIGLIPDRRLGVYVLANLDHAEVRHALMFRAFDLFAGRPSRDWSTELRQLYAGLEQGERAAEQSFTASRVPNTKPTLPMGAYAGTFADSLNGTIEIDEAGGSLRVRRGKSLSGALEHWHFDTFFARWDDKRLSPTPITFIVGMDGSVASLKIGRTEYGRVRVR